MECVFGIKIEDKKEQRGVKEHMREKISILLLVLCLFAVGCSNQDVRKDMEQIEVTSKPATEQEEKPINKQGEEDEIGYGYRNISPNTVMEVFEYNGEPIEIPYYLSVRMATGHDVGFVIFIGGVQQEYSIIYADGTVSDKGRMHLFPLDERKEEEFTICVEPNIGKAGEKLGIYMCSIIYPSFQPESEAEPSYQYFGQLGQNSPQQVKFNVDAERKKYDFAQTENGQKIPKDLLELYDIYDTKSLKSLDGFASIEFYEIEREEAYMKAKNGKLSLNLDVFGGVQRKYYVTVYINHQPVLVDGKDMIEVDLEKNTMSTYKFDLDVSEYGEYSTIYAILVPADESYLDAAQVCISGSKLVVNK